MEAVNYPFVLGEDETADNGLVKFEFHYQQYALRGTGGRDDVVSADAV